MDNSNQKVRIGSLVDDDGVILTEVYQGDKIVRESQSDYKQKHITNFNEKELFVKVYINPIKELWKTLSIREYAVASALMQFISYKDGILRDNGVAINMKDISRLLEMDYDAIRKIIPVLEKKKILGKVKRKSDKYADKEKNYLVVNPYLFLRGTDIEKEIADMFSSSVWANLKDSENKKDTKSE
jgi:DNA-binding MarR family transcriptional regulator